MQGLKRAIDALNMKPNFRLTEGRKSYDLLAELDKLAEEAEKVSETK